MTNSVESLNTIAHLSTLHPRHDTRIFLKEARTLAQKQNAKVYLLVADGKGDSVAERGEVSIKDLGTFPFGRIGRMIVGPIRALISIRRLAPDVVHFHDPELLPICFLLHWFGYRIIYDVHEDVPRQILTKYWIPWVLRKPAATILSLVEKIAGMLFWAIVPATEHIADRFPSQKTFVVKNYPMLEEMSGSDKGGIPYRDRGYRFLYPGAIAEVRGLVEVIEAIHLLLEYPDSAIDLAGWFEPAEFRCKLEKLPGWKRVEYHGELDRTALAKLFGNARAGLVAHHPIPNEIHALPIKLFEFMGAGLPVIVSDFPPLRKIVEEAQCGVVLDNLTPQGIADAMRWVFENPCEAEKMGMRGREAVKQKYNWNTEAAKLLELYGKLPTEMHNEPPK